MSADSIRILPALVLALATTAAQAQETYPARPVTVIVPLGTIVVPLAIAQML